MKPFNKYILNIFNFCFPLVKPSAFILHENVSTIVGEQLKLICTTKGDPEPHVIWKKDGATQIPRTKLNSPENRTLVIDSVILEDSGKYDCYVRNRVGETSSRSWDKCESRLALNRRFPSCISPLFQSES